MKTHLSVIGMLPFFFAGAVLADDSAFNPDSNRTRIVSAFLSKLQLVADSGRLDIPDDIGKLLELSFTSTTVEQEPQPPDCSKQMSVKSSQITTNTITGVNWYRPTTEGVKSLSVPGFTINPPFTINESSPTTVGYVSHRLLYCNDPHVTLRDTTTTTLRFENLPRFVCITARDIESGLPNIGSHEASDGYHIYDYAGNKNDSSGSRLKFVFRAMVACALNVEVEQSTRMGLRYEKANAKYMTCRRRFMATYREDNPPVKLGNFDYRDTEAHTKYDQDMVASEKYILRMCGTFEDEYRDAWLP